MAAAIEDPLRLQEIMPQAHMQTEGDDYGGDA